MHYAQRNMEREGTLHDIDGCDWMQYLRSGIGWEVNLMQKLPNVCEVIVLYMGYCEETKAYRLMCLQSKKIINVESWYL